MAFLKLLFAVYCGLAIAGSSSAWSYTAGQATVSKKGDTEGTSTSFGPHQPLPSPFHLTSKESLRLTLNLDDGGTPGRPHQAFLLLRDKYNHLETFYPLAVKMGSGKAKIDLTHREIPSYLLGSETLSLSLALGSFGESAPLLGKIGTIIPVVDQSSKAALAQQKLKDLGEGNVVYMPKNEIRHVFRVEPTSPNVLITLPFIAAALIGLGVLLITWFAVLGANFAQFPKSLQAATLSHLLFFGSLMCLEGVFFLYYIKLGLFKTLGIVGIIGVIATFSGSRALREVRSRRERGEL